ncbi:CbtB domain-containing protein [Prosthecomicrobium pneumaticum]|uniref:Cobalt transporter subunit CbtB n=1 Tax=Prosthecomicrobium pneumaticum TaxID=81895 RepID=A0A7W9FPU1_9HYPH|nr:CbtB domain-containing protein [Prosthecomicrobium pneumaticum]MBB5754575.1 cobalt transporter subunit CbtB [Prosthecomicrobium pneumaticum]
MTISTEARAAAGLSARIVPALGAVLLGLALFLGTGFAAPSAIHNATHDTRHSFGLPCH